MNKLDYSRALACHFVRMSFCSQATHELYTKINGKHASMVHTSVKFKLSCTLSGIIIIMVIMRLLFPVCNTYTYVAMYITLLATVATVAS